MKPDTKQMQMAMEIGMAFFNCLEALAKVMPRDLYMEYAHNSFGWLYPEKSVLDFVAGQAWERAHT